MTPRPEETLSVEVRVFADMTVAKVRGHTASGGGKRGSVTRFSKASRKRMLDKLGKIRADFRLACFMTLTYPKEWPEDPRRWKRDLDAMIKRIRRKFEKASGIWRIEFQERGAPHFHLIVWGMDDRTGIIREWLSRSWYNVVGSGDLKHYRAGTNLTRLRNRKRAGYYVSKYSAKVAGTPVRADTGEVVAVGRWWGVFGDLDIGLAIRAVLSIPEFHALRRQVARLLRSRRNSYWRTLAHGDGRKGWSVYGVGDMSNDKWISPFDNTMFLMIESVLHPELTLGVDRTNFREYA